MEGRREEEGGERRKKMVLRRGRGRCGGVSKERGSEGEKLEAKEWRRGAKGAGAGRKWFGEGEEQSVRET